MELTDQFVSEGSLLIAGPPAMAEPVPAAS